MLHLRLRGKSEQSPCTGCVTNGAARKQTNAEKKLGPKELNGQPSLGERVGTAHTFTVRVQDLQIVFSLSKPSFRHLGGTRIATRLCMQHKQMLSHRKVIIARLLAAITGQTKKSQTIRLQKVITN